MRQHGRRGVRAMAVMATLSVAAVGVFAAGASAQSGAAPGVTDKAVKIGFISSETGVAGVQLRRRRQGLPGPHRRRERQGRRQRPQDRPDVIDDKSGAGNNTAAKDLVQNQNVFAVVNDSSFAFLTYRYLLDAGSR